MLSRTLVALVALIVAAPAVVAGSEPTAKWLRRIDDAQRIALADGKDLLINFTGSEWCLNCILLQRAVLSTPAFVEGTRDFVLVELDLPNDREQLGELQDLYAQWVSRYLIQSYPTVILADSSGRPYAYFAGYQEGQTPDAFVARVRNAREARVTRDRELTAAQAATGPARALRLHAAIAAVALGLGSLADRGDDPVLAFYGDEVDEIRRLDVDSGLQLKPQYDARIAARDLVRRRQSILQELEAFSNQNDWAAAIAYLDRRLPEIPDSEIRFQLECRRAAFLEYNQQFAESLAAVQRLVADPRCLPADRDRLLFSEAMCLRRLGRTNEAIASLDRQIAAAANQPGAQRSLKKARAQVLGASQRRDEAVAAYRELVAITEPRSAEGVEAKGLLAMALSRNGQHAESIDLWREVIADSEQGPSTDAIPFYYLAMARSQQALGRNADARQSLDRMERAIPKVASKPAEQNLIDRLQKELAETRQTVGTAK